MTLFGRGDGVRGLCDSVVEGVVHWWSGGWVRGVCTVCAAMMVVRWSLCQELKFCVGEVFFSSTPKQFNDSNITFIGQTPHFHPPSLTPSTQPSQTNMDHSHMSHGDMDMGGSDSQCQMNVHPPYSPSLPIRLPSRPPSPDLHQPPTDLSPPTDALHLLHPQPLHHLPLLAHNHHPLPPPLPPRHHPPHRWLRARPRRQSEIPSPQR